jgi:hypothetical protein
MPEGWVIQAAAEFWAVAPGGGAFPRDVARAVPWALPAAVCAIPELWLTGVQRYLQALGIPHYFPDPDRRLRGCLVAYAGRGLMFVDAEDSEDERRYTVAHEVGHFVADYLDLRRATLRRLGPAGLEVLDGLRAPTAAERFRAALAGQRLAAHVHLMDREGAELEARSRADRLAVELLAPEAEALDRLAGAGATAPALALRAAFGLPPAVAATYARWLAPPAAGVSGGWLLDGLRRRTSVSR